MEDYAYIEAREAVLQSITALADLGASHIAIYLTILFAYCVVAYAAGRELTRLQLALTTFLFVAAAAYEVVAIVSISYATALKTAHLQAMDELARETAPRPSEWLMGSLWSSGIVAALIFMWSVRRGDGEKDERSENSAHPGEN